MAATEVDLSVRTYLQKMVWNGLKWRTRLFIGRLYQKINDGLQAASDDYSTFCDRSGKKFVGPLNEDEKRLLTAYQDTKVTMDDAKRRSSMQFSDEMLEMPLEELKMQHKGTRLLYETLKNNGSGIKTVANIGARVDSASSYLALKFPEITFVSVDLQDNLREANSFLPQSPNWTFESGYALDLLRARKISPDLVYMTSASVLFNGVELDAYFDAMQDTVKVVVLNEPWWPKVKTWRLFFVPTPESIPVDTPYCGGRYACYHHNYIAKLESRGYNVLSSKLFEGHKTACTLQLVARKAVPS
jgi:hypothetical protein